MSAQPGSRGQKDLLGPESCTHAAATRLTPGGGRHRRRLAAAERPPGASMPRIARGRRDHPDDFGLGVIFLLQPWCFFLRLNMGTSYYSPSRKEVREIVAQSHLLLAICPTKAITAVRL